MIYNILSLKRRSFYKIFYKISRKRVVKFLRWGHHCFVQNITFPIKYLSESFLFWRVKNFSKTRCETNAQGCYFFDRRCFPERGWWSFWDEVTTVCLHPINWSGHNNHIGDNREDDDDYQADIYHEAVFVFVTKNHHFPLPSWAPEARSEPPARPFWP